MTRPRKVCPVETEALRKRLQEIGIEPAPGYTVWVTDTRRGRCRYAHQTCTVPLWATQRNFDAEPDEDFALYYAAHECAHSWNFENNGELAHGTRFMEFFRDLCPKDLQHWELTYKPKLAAAAGIQEKPEMSTSKEVTTADPQHASLNEVALPPDPFISMIERVAANPDVDADKLEKIVGVQMSIMDKQAEVEFNAAFAQVQEQLPIVTRQFENTHTGSMYAKHEAIAKAIKPIYTAAGFGTTFSEGTTDKEKHIRICGTLFHRAGHSRDYHVDLPLDTHGSGGSRNKTDLHGTGSTFQYGRRYLTLFMFDVATGEDNDGVMPTISEEQVANLLAKAEELFGSDGKKRLLIMCDKVFRVPGPIDLAERHYETALEWLAEAHNAEQDDELKADSRRG